MAHYYSLCVTFSLIFPSLLPLSFPSPLFLYQRPWIVPFKVIVKHSHWLQGRRCCSSWWRANTECCRVSGKVWYGLPHCMSPVLLLFSPVNLLTARTLTNCVTRTMEEEVLATLTPEYFGENWSLLGAPWRLREGRRGKHAEN